ncbi:MAG TPA: hypothetical protein VHH73_11045, partial [Verrucomicrobiae bacterium]|nr:hypothetical protein [Verrucomicrobiae bacterium]
VYFVHDGWVVLACENAFLAGEDDLRAWGQQIGSQMNDGAHLKFGPFITPTPMPVARAPDGTWYKPYRIKFLLDMPPVARLQQAPPGVHLCLVWTEGQNGRKSVGFRENWSEEQFDAGKPPPPARFFPETG